MHIYKSHFDIKETVNDESNNPVEITLIRINEKGLTYDCVDNAKNEKTLTEKQLVESNPIHPGPIIEILLKEKNIVINRELALTLGTSNGVLRKILNGEKPIDAATALNLEKMGIGKAQDWTDMSFNFEKLKLNADNNV